MGCYHHVAECDLGPQGSGHPDKQNGGRGELGYCPLGQHRRRVISLTNEG